MSEGTCEACGSPHGRERLSGAQEGGADCKGALVCAACIHGNRGSLSWTEHWADTYARIRARRAVKQRDAGPIIDAEYPEVGEEPMDTRMIDARDALLEVERQLALLSRVLVDLELLDGVGRGLTRGDVLARRSR